MNVLSRKKRVLYLVLSTIAFVVITPIIALYSTGYRFDKTFAVLKTGGIYIITQSRDFNVYVNGELQDVSSLFRRNFLIQDIRQGSYHVRVAKDGFTSWEKDVTVLPEKVNEVTPFNLPTDIKPVLIEKLIAPLSGNTATSSTSTATTSAKTKKIPNEAYAHAAALFAPAPIGPKKESSDASDLNITPHHKITLTYEGLVLHTTWLGQEDAAPNIFCNIEYCVHELSVALDSPIKRAEFFFDRQDLVIFSTAKGIFVVELDGRGGRNMERIIEGVYDFRLGDDGALYLKKGSDTYYRIDLAL